MEVWGRWGGELIWIIGAEPQYDIPVRSHGESIPPHWHGGKSFIPYIIAGVVGGAGYGLEGVAVQVERVTAGVVVVEDDIDDLVAFEDEGVGVGGVDGGIGGILACREGSVEGGDFWGNVGDGVEGGAGGY